MTTALLPERSTTRIRGLTLNEAARLLPYATGLSAGLSIGLVSYKIWRTPHFAHFAAVSMWALAAFAVSLILGAWIRRRAAPWSGRVSSDGMTSWIIALELGVLVLGVPVLLLVKSVPEEDMTGWLW